MESAEIKFGGDDARPIQDSNENHCGLADGDYVQLVSSSSCQGPMKAASSSIDLRTPLFARSTSENCPPKFAFTPGDLMNNPDHPGWDQLAEELKKRHEAASVLRDRATYIVEKASKKAERLIGQTGSLKCRLAGKEAVLQQDQGTIQAMAHLIKNFGLESEQLKSREKSTKAEIEALTAKAQAQDQELLEIRSEMEQKEFILKHESLMSTKAELASLKFEHAAELHARWQEMARDRIVQQRIRAIRDLAKATPRASLSGRILNRSFSEGDISSVGDNHKQAHCKPGHVRAMISRMESFAVRREAGHHELPRHGNKLVGCFAFKSTGPSTGHQMSTGSSDSQTVSRIPAIEMVTHIYASNNKIGPRRSRQRSASTGDEADNEDEEFAARGPQAKEHAGLLLDIA